MIAQSSLELYMTTPPRPKPVPCRTQDLQVLALTLGLGKVKEPQPKQRGLTWKDDSDVEQQYTIKDVTDNEFNEYDSDGSD